MALKLKSVKPRRKNRMFCWSNSKLRYAIFTDEQSSQNFSNIQFFYITGTRKWYRGPLRVHRPHFNSHCSIWYTFWATPLYHNQGFWNVGKYLPTFRRYVLPPTSLSICRRMLDPEDGST